MSTIEDNNNQLGKNIRHLRKMNGETQEELGNSIFLSKSGINQYESGERNPDRSTLAAIARHYGKTVDELLNSDLTVLGDLRVSIDGMNDAIEKWKTIFPLASSAKGLKNQNFKKGYEICVTIQDRFSRNEVVIPALMEEAADLFENALNEGECPEAAANTLWIVFLCWSQLIDSEMTAALESLIYNSNDAVAHKKVMSARAKETDIIIKKKKAFLDDLDGQDMEMIRILKEDPLWSNLGDYYLALKYMHGMVDSGLSRELNETIGMQLMLSLVQLDNKYAYRLLNISLDS